MKKTLILAVMLLILPASLFADLVNLSKPGTPWVWRVEDGINTSGDFALVEDGSSLVSEAGARMRLEENEYWYLFLEDGERVLTEKGEVILTDAFSAENYSALYLQLTGQGWTLTESNATVPQGIDGTAYALSVRFGLAEDGTFLVNENTNNIRMEN